MQKFRTIFYKIVIFFIPLTYIYNKRYKKYKEGEEMSQKPLKVVVSFKEQEREMYEFLSSKMSPSIYIKELLKTQIDKEKASIKKDAE